MDVHYLSTGGAWAAAVLAADPLSRACWPNPPRRYPGYLPTSRVEFYRRELPPLRGRDDLSGLGLPIVDGYADLDPTTGPAWARMRTPRSPSR